MKQLLKCETPKTETNIEPSGFKGLQRKGREYSSPLNPPSAQALGTHGSSSQAQASGVCAVTSVDVHLKSIDLHVGTA
jgi:hypothetical protein